MKTRTRTNVKVVSILIAVIMIMAMLPTTSYAFSKGITGKTTVAVEAYTGPSSTLYTSIGHIPANSTVWILGEENGWYHIAYRAGDQEASAYIHKSNITQISGGTPHVEVFTGGYRVAAVPSQDIWTCDDINTRVSLGTLKEGEGVTLLYQYKNGNNTIAFIEYVSPWGTERGYLFYPGLNNNVPGEVTGIARVNISVASVFYGPSRLSYDFKGSVFKDELVTILRQSGGWTWIDYNTPSGRKQGYTMSGNLTALTSTSQIHSISENNTGGQSLTARQVYGGPSSMYPVVYTIQPMEEFAFLFGQRGLGMENSNWSYVLVLDRNTGYLKRGYLI